MEIIKFIKQWRFTFILLFAVGSGAAVGYIVGDKAVVLKPFGDVFLNLLFTAVVPLVFFSLSSAVAASSSLKRLGRIAGTMLAVFVVTGLVSSLLMIVAVKTFDPVGDLKLQLEDTPPVQAGDIGQRVVETFTVADFPGLLSRRNILALIVFSILTGVACQMTGDRGRGFREFLISGSEVMAQLIKLIMLYAPIGLGAYFAYMVGRFGPELVGSYAKVVGLYYPIAFLYFVLGFSVYAFVASGRKGVGAFWKNIPPVALTAWGTGSSLAALPANLEAAKRIGVDEDVREIVLPLGATIHMDGSCLAAIMKIAVLFALFGRDFSGIEVYAGAIGVSLLCGIVMSGIPGGGFLGEALIVSLYGFGPEALPVIAMLGTLVDPPATMINASGDSVAAMIVNRIVSRKKSVS